MKRLIIMALAAILNLLVVETVNAGESSLRPPEQHPWSFNGVFGTFDRGALQRGYLVYKEVCASCHSLGYVHFRNLVDIGFSEKEVKAIAVEYEVEDGPDETGNMYQRTARLSDEFVAPFDNDIEARAANGGALPPDLSLIVKARSGGEDYVYALLTGYEDSPPEGTELGEGMNYNPYFSGGQISMSPPLFQDAVEYADGTAATEAQMAMDVVSFLTWAAEPKLEERKRLGFKVVIFLIVLTALLYASKRRIWRGVH